MYAYIYMYIYIYICTYIKGLGAAAALTLGVWGVLSRHPLRRELRGNHLSDATCLAIYIYIYIYIYIERERYVRGNHLSDATCLTQVFFNSGE